MTPQRFRECLDQIGWNLRGFSNRVGSAETTVRRWAEGAYPVPDQIARWLEKLAAVHERNPVPAKPKEGRLK